MSNPQNVGKYMDGRGVMQRTRDLNEAMQKEVDALWAALPAAFVGSCAALIGPMIGMAVVFAPGAGEPSLWRWVGGATFAALCVFFGIRASLPWWRAERNVRRAMKAVREHREAMEAETKRYGRGWAES